MAGGKGKSRMRRDLRVMDGFVWCLHCERAWSVSCWPEDRMFCPAADCDGGPMDRWRWCKIRSANRDYPVVPINGGIYQQYGGMG